jgi:hypothetical protein
MIDFKGVFYDARCLLLHLDPYKAREPVRIYLADGGTLPQSMDAFRLVLERNVYPPTALLVVAPFAMLPWKFASFLWLILTVAAFSLASFLIWDSTKHAAPVVACALICFLLLNTEIFFSFGNPAGIAVSLCVVAVWCFLKDRLVSAGVVCLALSLAIKPHDTGFVWLYFLLAGGIYRKWALQTLAVIAAVSLAAVLWVSFIAPIWMQELHANLLVTAAPGGTSDPGLPNVYARGANAIIGLQSALAVFRNDPHFYNSISYLICGVLLLIWSVATLRSQFSQRRAWLALAAVVPLTMLVTYHRPYDAKLLLLTVPACAVLWAAGGPIRWLALLITSAGIVFTADIPLIILGNFTRNSQISEGDMSSTMLAAILMRPIPLILLGTTIFYLWVYLRNPAGGGKKSIMSDVQFQNPQAIPE